jgi:GNAT superfamily N-acetyltransferase
MYGVTMTAIRDIEMAAKSSLRKSIPCYEDTDRLDVDELLNMIRLSYVSGQASDESGDSTGVQLTLHPDSRVMWIRKLHVASGRRSREFGRKLTLAVERLAQRVGISRINLMPLGPALPFWRKMGYAPHPWMARVLSKLLDE